MLEWEQISPVLHATYRLLNERPNGSVRDEEVAALLPDIDPEQVSLTLGILKDMDYIGAYRASGGRRIDSIVPRERGLQATMGWPTPGDAQSVGADVLLRVLDERIAEASTPEERTRFARLRDAAADTGQNVLSEALGAWLARMTGAS